MVSSDGGVFSIQSGSFFFNAELDWVNRTTKFHRSLNGSFFGAPDRTDGRGSLFAPRYIEAWRWMVETGFMLGPAKASFICAWLPGPDRRNGVLIDRQPYFYGFGNYGLFGPYSLLMRLLLRSWTGLIQPESDGYMNDASILAANWIMPWHPTSMSMGVLLGGPGIHPGYGWGFMRPAAPGTGSGVEFAHLSTINAVTPMHPRFLTTTLGWELSRYRLAVAGQVDREIYRRLLAAGEVVQLCLH